MVILYGYKTFKHQWWIPQGEIQFRFTISSASYIMLCNVIYTMYMYGTESTDNIE